MQLTDKKYLCVFSLVHTPLLSSFHFRRPLACTVSSVRDSVLNMFKWHWHLARSSCMRCLPWTPLLCALCGHAGRTGGRHDHPVYRYWCGFGDLCCLAVQCDSGCNSESTCWNPCEKSACVPRPGDWCLSWTTWRSTSWLSFSSYFNERQNSSLSEF